MTEIEFIDVMKRIFLNERFSEKLELEIFERFENPFLFNGILALNLKDYYENQFTEETEKSCKTYYRNFTSRSRR